MTSAPDTLTSAEGLTLDVVSPRRGRRLTLLDVAYANLRRTEDERDRRGVMKGHLDAARAVAVIWQLAVAREALGHWPTQQEYADHWGVGLREAQRDWSQFRDGFPTETDPQRLAAALHSEASSRLAKSGPAIASGFPADDLALA